MKLTTFLFLILFPLITFCQEFSEPLRVNSDTTLTDREPAMHVGPSGSIYVSWIKVGAGSGAGDAYFSRSDDGGRSFIPSVRATMGAKIPADLQRGAAFAIDTKGTIHMAWVENRVNSQPDVWYIQSTNNGTTWTMPPVLLSDDSSMYAQDFPSLACDSSGNVYLSFLDSREEQTGKSQFVQLYLRKSTDNGLTWSPARRVNNMPGGIGGTCECCKQDIQAGLNGFVTVAFRSNINNRRDIFAIRSTDFGETFSEAMPIQAQEWMLSACPTTGPNSYLTRDGDLHITWRDSRQAADEKSHIYYDLLKHDRAEPEFRSMNNLRIDDTENSPNWPDLSVFGNYVAIAYQAGSLGNDKSTYVLLGTDGTTYFKTQFPRASEKRFLFTEFGADGTRYFLWQDAGFKTNDIVFMKDTSQLPSLRVTNSDRNEQFFLSPNPVISGGTIGVRTGQLAERYSLIDLLGRTVFVGQLSNDHAVIPKIPGGQYLFRLGSGESIKLIVTD